MWSVLLTLLLPISAQFYDRDFFSIDVPNTRISSNNNNNNNNYNNRFLDLLTTLEKRVSVLEKKVVGLQEAAHADWNQTDSGSMFKLFEERKNWDDAEKFCQSLDAHLAVVENEIKNKFLHSLIQESKTADYIWIGMKTKTSTTEDSESFSNFAAESPIHGCAVMDRLGVWSIRSCTQLRPFICQMVVIR